MSRRVVVTGVGAVSGFGWGVGRLWEGLRAGRTGIGSFRRFDHTLHRTHVAAEAGAPPPGPLPPFSGLAPALAGRPLRPVRRGRGRGAGRP